jgi:ribosomal protein S18 acetylase RimI-like enzyme
MNEVIASIATIAHQDELVGILVLAFARDPFMRWLWPEPSQYLANFPEFARASGGRAFAHGSAYSAAGFVGGALWLPPGVEQDREATRNLMRRTLVPNQLATLREIGKRMDSFHLEEPHWYLPLIGVDPAKQGRGHGSVLLRFALACVDRDRRAACLVSSSPANIPLYRKHGFETLGTIQVDDAPPMFPMIREAHRG